jgi:UDP-glucose 4-epimerase
MRILVTGVAGFMGSHLAEYLAKEGHEVYGIDNESIGLKENVPTNIKYARVDMRWSGSMKSVIEKCKPELVYHLACWAHEGLSQFMPQLITENNYNAFLNLIVPCINNGMKRIVVCSSMSVYGAQKPPFDESLPRQPEDVYAIAKAAMEHCTEVLADVHGFDYTIIRPHNVYGPKQMLHDPYRNVVGIFINRLLHGEAPIIYGDGNQTRAFSYIDDVTPYLANAGFNDEAKGQIINIGPTEEYSVNTVAQAVLQAFGSDLAPIHFPDRPREVKHAYCTNEKAQKILGYKTSTSLEQGIQQFVTWAKLQGPKEFKYLDELELTGDKVPATWKEKLI